jgi:hypothetical protein
MEVEIGNAPRPICIDIRHIHPGHVGFGEGVEEAVRRLIDPRDAKDIIDIGNYCKTCFRYEVGGCISSVGSISVDVQTLNLCCSVPREKVSSRTRKICNRDEFVKIPLYGCFSY